jgi:5-methyltetrahydrofolate--homocysteine methyltransferase
MIGPAMFRCWVLPALEEEAALVGHAYYHWDGPDAVKHLPDLAASKGLHTLSYVPGGGRGQPVEYIELYKRVQALGKAVHVWGTPNELKKMHKELRPEKTMYSSTVASIAEADELVEWFVKNT